MDYSESNTIARFNSKTRKWSKAGELFSAKGSRKKSFLSCFSSLKKITFRTIPSTARHGHNVIFDGSHVMVFGGFQYEPDNDKFKMLKSEKCTLSNSRFFCKQQKPLLSANHYPELFLVEHDFCKIKP